jgi:hypothetical protein
MIRTFALLSLSALALGAAPPAALPDSEAGFVSLFDGKTLQGWEGNPDLWRVDNGILTGETTAAKPTAKNTFLIWRGGQTTDFELKLDVRVSPKANSGIQYRSTEVPGVPFGMAGYQADLDGGNAYTGMVYEERGRGFACPRSRVTRIGADAKVETLGTTGSDDDLKANLHPGDWNSLHLIVRGWTSILIWNGRVTAVLTDDDTAHRRADGLLGIQLHAGPPMKVEYRNIRYKKL